jgi:hypothetical protein
VSVVRILLLKCDGCGKTAQGADPRYDVRGLRRFLRSLGWATRGANGQGDVELCPGCVRGRVTIRSAEESDRG